MQPSLIIEEDPCLPVFNVLLILRILVEGGVTCEVINHGDWYDLCTHWLVVVVPSNLHLHQLSFHLYLSRVLLVMIPTKEIHVFFSTCGVGVVEEHGVDEVLGLTSYGEGLECCT